ncbi:diaminopimelate epimerase [Halocola ammonii]
MELNFYKYHGTGNDFILVDDRRNNFTSIDLRTIQKLCERRFGIGSDGIIFIRECDDADFEMDFYNPDGSKSFCGNGSRCAVSFANRLGMISEACTFRAVDGMHEAKLVGERVSVKMRDVEEVEVGIDHHFIDTGSPHYIVYRDDINSIDLVKEARIIRYGERFAEEGTNVNLVKETSEGVFVRTYERGVEDETYSCGTGVTAVALSYGLLHPEANHVNIETKGGKLEVSFRSAGENRFSDIWLTGPAKRVFTGKIEID